MHNKAHFTRVESIEEGKKRYTAVTAQDSSCWAQQTSSSSLRQKEVLRKMQ